MSELGICVIGAGQLGNVHADAWTTVPGGKLVSVADPDTDRAKATCDRLGFQSWHDSYADALDQPGVNTVSVAVPSSLHRVCSEAAMERGYHVICEKPISLSIEDATSMIATRDRMGVKLAIGLCKRFMGQVQTVRELVQGGSIGRPCVYRFISGWERRPKLWIMDKNWGGGPIIDFCCHYFDQWRVIFGAEPFRIKAAGMTFSEGAEELPGVEPEVDTASFTVEYTSGDVGVLSITWGLPRGVTTGNHEDLIGPDGAITVHSAKQVTLTTKGGDREFTDLDADMHPKQLAAFASAIREDGHVGATAEDALLALRVSHAVIESIHSGRAVEI